MAPNHKTVVFEVKERPVIRRIRYDNIHSVSESDILDRFKERKVGLTVESQFDPTRIKKAEVVLKELLASMDANLLKSRRSTSASPPATQSSWFSKLKKDPR